MEDFLGLTPRDDFPVSKVFIRVIRTGFDGKVTSTKQKKNNKNK